MGALEPVVVRLPPAHLGIVDAIAEAEGVTLAEMVRVAVSDYAAARLNTADSEQAAAWSSAGAARERAWAKRRG